MKRRIVLLALALAATVGLSGCQAIPSSGDVELGLTDLSQAEQLVQFNPLGPVAGSSQEDIVRGFLLAAASSENDYAVAREFLTPAYAYQWDPSLGVLIDEGSRPFSPQGDLRGTMDVSAIASVDAEGDLLPVMPGLTADLRFEFEEVGGEWRIASAPAGIVLDRATFTAVWSPHDLYFIGPMGTLVPEVRWYQNRSPLPTEITKGLLAGPHLDEAAVTAFPPDTALVGDNVPIVDGLARVELTSNVLDLDDEQFTAMHRQLLESLRSVSGVSSVEIYVDGTLVQTPEAGSEIAPATTEVTNPALLMGDQFGVFANGELTAVPDISEGVVALAPDAITLSDDESIAAVRAANGVTLLSAGGSLLVDARSAVLEPSLDHYGYVWVYGDGELIAANLGDEQVTIDAPWLENNSPVALRVSPDGSRIATLSSAGSGRSVVVEAQIIRDENGLPVSISEEPVPRMYANGAPVDLDWIDGTRFAALTRQGAQAKVTVGGPGLIPSEQGAVPDGVRISSGGSRTQLRVLADNGGLFVSQGSGWQKSLDDVAVLAKRD